MTSAITPITGRFRSRVIRDLVGSISVGTVLGYGYWSWHESWAKGVRAYESQVAAEIKQVHDEWAAARK